MSLYTRGRVEMTVVSGSGLASKDRNGKSDPYCLVKAHRQGLSPEEVQPQHKTKIIKKTLEPVWSEAVPAFEVGRNSMPPFGHFKDVVRIEVWDWDKIGSDDFMGLAQLVLQDDPRLVSGKEVELELELGQREGKPKEEVSGTIKVQITWTNLELELEAKAKEAERLEAEARAAREKDQATMADLSAKAAEDPSALAALLELVHANRKLMNVKQYVRPLHDNVTAMINDGRVSKEDALPLLLPLLFDLVVRLIPDAAKAPEQNPIKADPDASEFTSSVLSWAFSNDVAKNKCAHVITYSIWTTEFYWSEEMGGWLKDLRLAIDAVTPKENEWPLAGYGVGLTLHAVLSRVSASRGLGWNNSALLASTLGALHETGLGRHPYVAQVLRSHKGKLVELLNKEAGASLWTKILIPCFEDPAQLVGSSCTTPGIWF